MPNAHGSQYPIKLIKTSFALFAEQKSASESGTDSNVSPTRKSSTVSLDRKLLTDRAKRSSPARKKISCCSRAEGSYESETSMSLGNPDDRAPLLLKKKLNDVIQEGILDSILPYLLPKQQIGQENSHVVPKKVLNVNGNWNICLLKTSHWKLFQL